jgi:hypothetical protein
MTGETEFVVPGPSLATKYKNVCTSNRGSALGAVMRAFAASGRLLRITLALPDEGLSAAVTLA